jgi:hypothetical protein
LITLTILGEEYKPCSSSLCSFLQPPVTLCSGLAILKVHWQVLDIRFLKSLHSPEWVHLGDVREEMCGLPFCSRFRVYSFVV